MMAKIVNQEFDQEVWDELLLLFGRDGVGELVETLQRDLPHQREQLASALPAGARGAIRHIAHSLHGVALQFGATRLAGDCGEIEQRLDAGATLDELAPLAARMLDQMEALTRQLREALDAG